jgi:hypothetical protein
MSGGQVSALPTSLANTVRCCGRKNTHYHPNKDADQVAPWGHGDNFNVSKVPPALRSIVEMIQKSPLFAVGKPRNISVNKRRNSFFKLDPHINDIDDGENIFTLNLNSNVVYTFTPPGEFERSDPVQCATRSWSDKDIDVLVRHRSLLLTSGLSVCEWCVCVCVCVCMCVGKWRGRDAGVRPEASGWGNRAACQVCLQAPGLLYMYMYM